MFRRFSEVLSRCARNGVLAGVAFGASALVAADTAHADVSAWAYAGGGVSSAAQQSWKPNSPLLQLDAGIGTDPASPFVGGLLFRTFTHFGHGTEGALLFRATHSAFVTGVAGVALDVGPYQRWFGGNKSIGGLVSLNVALPWGFTLSGSAGMGQDKDRVAALSFGIDWARFTVNRSVSDSWWHNYKLPLPEKDSGEVATAPGSGVRRGAF